MKNIRDNLVELLTPLAIIGDVVMKKFKDNEDVILKWLCIMLCFFFAICKPKAYAVVDSTLGRLQPAEDIKASLLSNWGNQFGTSYNSGSDFQTYTSLGQFWYGGSVSGEYLDVVADYYVGFETIGPDTIYNYLPYDQNTLTADNLRCGIGDFRLGYDSTYAPAVSDFKVELSDRTYENIKQYQYHIKFKYHQRINPVVKSSTNLNCYFNVPSGKFFLQLKVNNGNLRIGYYNSVFNWSVSDDPNSKLLNEINNNQKITNEKLDNINNNQVQTNQKLDDLKDTLKSDDVDDKSSFFTDFSSADHGLSGVITAPLRAVSKITATCQPVIFSVLDEPIELPCGDTLFWNKESVKSFKIVWNLLVGGPLIYFLIKKLFKVIEGLKNPDDDRIEVLDL